MPYIAFIAVGTITSWINVKALVITIRGHDSPIPSAPKSLEVPALFYLYKIPPSIEPATHVFR